MHISQLYTYPIKSLRPVVLQEAEVTKHGFPYDRRFMLLKRHKQQDGSPERLENMHIGIFAEMCLFIPTMRVDAGGDKGALSVAFTPPSSTDTKTIEFDLTPDVSTLRPIEIKMHCSDTIAYDMGENLNTWFSSCFGYPVMLAYLGPHHRPVLFPSLVSEQKDSWFSSLSSRLTGSASTSNNKYQEGITFADAAPYLVTTQESLDNVSARLPEGSEMDMTKFRPNIVVSGSAQAWDEDFWGAVCITTNNGPIQITLLHNCYRCQSINADYETGEFSTDEAGTVLKKLQKDRRVDRKKKWSAVFGRYGFLLDKNGGGMIRVGDEVVVSQRNEEHTAFDWPGI